MSESSAAKVWRVPSSEHPLLNVSYLAFLCVTLVLSGQMTARKRSHEIAERAITLDTMHSTDTKIIIIIIIMVIIIIISVVTNSKIQPNTEYQIPNLFNFCKCVEYQIPNIFSHTES